MSTLSSHTPAIPTTIAATPDAKARAIWTLVAEPGHQDVGALIEAVGAAEALRHVLDTEADTVADIDVRSIRDSARHRLSPDALDRAIQGAASVGATLLTPEHPDWPIGLDDLCHQAPYALWVRGDTAALSDTDAIAIIGARAATNYGEHTTTAIVSGLVERGRTIVSGAAYGIDGMAHRAALAAGGRTVAYIAGGVDRPYPSGHASLIERIAENGAVAAEAPCGAAPTKWRFLMRNRLIAAGSRATVVVEAGHRSGSLNTATHADSIARPVGAVPGPVTSVASAGCHRLIRDYGATLITDAEDAHQL